MFQVKERFKLSEKFLEQFKDEQPKWGPLGYVTFKRTYARVIHDEDGTDRTEEYWETVRRVVEGCYTIQLTQCKNLKLPWIPFKAQKSAQEMFNLMWNFKFLPPGRGLWMMGTDYIYERGSAALNNCAFVSTNEIEVSFSEPFCFLMDMSMLGVGVAFDTEGAGKVFIKQPQIAGYTHVVEDSKEGWVDLIRCILDSYVGIGKRPAHVDYSKIRPSGATIVTFGGIAPRPAP
ncbi:MAG: fused protease/ribonucleoside-triphosphate reductase, partial [Candidatus Hydrogenedentes bacterium]|nr:fused protease/ribonucleoside-triphosphate reductase [Candidatus Hydrogenedentota bacterium]